MSIFADRLREERNRLGLSQPDFGALGGVKKHTQLNYESGERSPSAEYLISLYEANVDVVYLLTGKRAIPLLQADEQLVIDGYKRLDERGKAGVLALISGLAPKSAIENNFAGDVGQVVNGDVTGSQTFTFNKK